MQADIDAFHAIVDANNINVVLMAVGQGANFEYQAALREMARVAPYGNNPESNFIRVSQYPVAVALAVVHSLAASAGWRSHR